MEVAEDGGSGRGAVALDFPAGAGAPARMPRRIRRRMMEGRSSAPLSAEEIEAKLREADLRRQKFHEWLSSKARPKPRSPSWSSQEVDLGQRLEAKLGAAEQKRLSLLAKAQMRLARLDELRQAAKTGVEMRFVKEREELGTKVESRVQQAEENRMRLLKADMQRRAAAKERTARSLRQRIIRENKYRESVQSAISQKRAAAEKKRMGLLEAEKTRARARVMQARRVAKTVCHQRESERRRMKEQLESRLQRAKRQRAEYLKQRGSPHSAARINGSKHGEYLSRKLARCWRRFVKSRRTTIALAKAYETLGINENSVKSMPFEQLALCIESATTLQTVKAFLDRLESRFLLSQSSISSVPENIDHLLKHLASPKRKGSSGKATRTKAATKKGSRSPETNKLSRYPVRVVLCAYMILGHPNAVFSGRGEREIVLAESAELFVWELELLVKIILDGPQSAHSSRLSSPDVMSDDWNHGQESFDQLPHKQTLRNQLEAFDKAWRSYLHCFVVWKVKDARALEEDLVRAACQLELSMMKTCKLAYEGQKCDLSHDMRAIQKQVTEDQQLLREKVEHLSGVAGIKRMECALSDTRSKFFESKESGSSSVGPVAHISSPGTLGPSSQPLNSLSEGLPTVDDRKSGHVVRSLFGSASSSPSKINTDIQIVDAQSNATKDGQLPTENELLVNEIVHAGCGSFAVDSDVADSSVKVKAKETMEKAFWDGVMDSLKGDKPNYSRIVQLVKELRDELYEMAPQSWKQEILERIDLDILSQVLESGTHDLDYLGRILEYALVMLQKLSAPVNVDEMRKAHNKLLSELSSTAQCDDKRSDSFIIATIKGLRFALEEMQMLKKEISKARIQMMEPIIKGPAGLEYLQKAFADRYGPPSDAANFLPLTALWISTLRNSDEEWGEHINAQSSLSTSHGLPPVTALRTGGSIPGILKEGLVAPTSSVSGGVEQPECNGEKIDIIMRLGLLKLVSQIEGLTMEMLPETLKLNFLRLRTAQSQLQQVIVISTSMLVLHQIIMSENSAIPPSDMDSIISNSAKGLCELLENSPDVGIEDIIEMLAGSSSEAKLQGKREVMAKVLTKSLQKDDPVFIKVSRSIYLATRGVVLGGSGVCGRRLADAVLRRVGASMLLDQVVKTTEVLIVLATVSSCVHGPWYRCLV